METPASVFKRKRVNKEHRRAPEFRRDARAPERAMEHMATQRAMRASGTGILICRRCYSCFCEGVTEVPICYSVIPGRAQREPGNLEIPGLVLRTIPE